MQLGAMHDISVCALLFVSALTLATLLYVADTADNAPDAKWTGFAGPFLFVYLMLAVFCCMTLAPLVTYYCSRNMIDPARQEERALKLRRATVGVAVASVIIVLFAVFFILLPWQLEAVQEHPHSSSWTGTLLVLLFAMATLWAYAVYRLVRGRAGGGEDSFLVPCCGAAIGIPICLGGGGSDDDTTDNAFAAERVRTPLQKWSFAYHVTLVVALGLATVAVGLLIPVLNHGKSPTIALWAIWTALVGIVIVGTVLLGMRITAAGRHDTAVTGSHGTRQTILLGVATLVAVLALVFSFLLLSPPSDAHVLFASLYAICIIAIVVLAFLAADAEMTTVYYAVPTDAAAGAGGENDVPTAAVVTGENVAISGQGVGLAWDTLPD